MKSPRKRSTRRADGVNCRLAIDHAHDGRRRRVEVTVQAHWPKAHGERQNGAAQAQAMRKLVANVRRDAIADVLAGLSSGHRLALLYRLLQGPATYRDLQEATQLKAGPLYHHIAALRLAGAVGPKNRNSYEITTLGQELALVSLLVGRLRTAAGGRRRQS